MEKAWGRLGSKPFLRPVKKRFEKVVCSGAKKILILRVFYRSFEEKVQSNIGFPGHSAKNKKHEALILHYL